MAVLQQQVIITNGSNLAESVQEFLDSGPIQDTQIVETKLTVGLDGEYCLIIFYT